MLDELFILENMREIPSWRRILAVSTAIWLSSYVYQVIQYRRAHQPRSSGQVPPIYPSLIPCIGIVIPLLWDTRNALTRFT